MPMSESGNGLSGNLIITDASSLIGLNTTGTNSGDLDKPRTSYVSKQGYHEVSQHRQRIAPIENRKNLLTHQRT